MEPSRPIPAPAQSPGHLFLVMITFGIIESSTVMVSAHRFSHVVDVMDVPNVR